ncbi:hypothetical protein M9H77_13908 [Catharanthus roseus]|uniref:Uncharacterized protein n=1 Tax=Catharanthus roseus TaxID=4058 RepID=A0ACC0BLR9_CATRO|nr:hypothetical protein M9H77_13908 [Catharanthus roseus]
MKMLFQPGPLPMTWIVLLTLGVDPLEEGCSTMEGFAQSVFTWISNHVLQWVGRLVKSQEGLETKCLAGIDYEMPELGLDDLVLESGLCLWNPTVALHVLLNSGVEAARMYLDSLKLPNYTRTLMSGTSVYWRILRPSVLTVVIWAWSRILVLRPQLHQHVQPDPLAPLGAMWYISFDLS